jgi:hypothetical protein
MRKTTKDIALILDVVRTAHMLRHSVAVEVSDRLAHGRQRLRDNRKWLRVQGHERPAHAEWKEKDCRRLLADAKRLRGLAKRFSSFRGEHPAATLPLFRDRERVCEPSVAEMARRNESAVYAKVA